MTELKKCPFCGMSVHWEDEDGIIHDSYADTYCNAPFPYRGEITVDPGEKESIIEEWNRRV